MQIDDISQTKTYASLLIGKRSGPTGQVSCGDKWGCFVGQQYLQMALNLEGGTPHRSIMASSKRRWFSFTTNCPMSSSDRISTKICTHVSGSNPTSAVAAAG